MPTCPDCGYKWTQPRKRSEKADEARRRNAKLGGRKPKVSPEKLLSIFNERTKWTAGDFKRQIEIETGVAYDRSHLGGMLKKLKELKSPAIGAIRNFLSSKDFVESITGPNRRNG